MSLLSNWKEPEAGRSNIALLFVAVFSPSTTGLQCFHVVAFPLWVF